MRSPDSEYARFTLWFAAARRSKLHIKELAARRLRGLRDRGVRERLAIDSPA